MKVFKILASLALAFNLYAADKDHTIVVAVSPVPHAEIMEFIKPVLAKEGYDLVIKEINDYSIPNLATQDGDLDANFFQHWPYLKNHNETKGTTLITAAAIHLEPLGFYSKKIKSLSELKDGAKVAIAYDPTNGNRALKILQKASLIELDKSAELATPKDIVKNPKRLNFVELEGAQIPRTLDEVDLAAISTNFVLDIGMNPKKDSLAIEGTESPYANIIAVKAGNENSPKIKALVKAATSPETKEFILKRYDGAILPVF